MIQEMCKALSCQYNKMSLEIILLICFVLCFRPIAFGFTLLPWGIQSQVLNYPISARCRFHLEVGHKSNELSVGYSHKLCPSIVLAYLAGRTALQINGFVPKLVFMILLWQFTGYVSVPMTLEPRPFIGSSSVSPCSVFCIGAIVSNRALQRATCSFGNCLGCLGGFLWDPFGQELNQM